MASWPPLWLRPCDTVVRLRHAVGAGEGEPSRRNQKSKAVDGHTCDGGEGVSGAWRYQPDSDAVRTPPDDE